MKNFKDMDFIHASASVRAMEYALVDGVALKKMMESKTMDEAYKVLTDKGIGSSYTYKDYQKALEENLRNTYKLLEEISPQKSMFGIFKVKYDGHNIKTLIKARAADVDPKPILMDLGNVPAEQLVTAFRDNNLNLLEPEIAQAATQATEVLAKSGDPQLVDILVDKAVQNVMLRMAQNVGSPFLLNLIKAQIDISNIRAFVRIKRMGKEVSLLRAVLCEGGTVSTGRLVECFPKSFEELQAVLASTNYGVALEPAFEDIKGKSGLTRFEKLCDNYQMSLLKSAKYVPFGEQPLIAFLLAKEAEIQAVRIVMASKLAGVKPEQIAERLRDTYA